MISDRDAQKWLTQALGLRAGETPFPWQCVLMRRFREKGIPAAIDIPTGLGKTSVMAIWLVARACGAKLPRRLVYVVDRRAVVDQATEVALRLRKLVDGEPTLRKALGLGENQSLPISTLRGQYVDNREWLNDPAAPAIIVGTVDMIGSRLLFEGYGVSRKMRPYHAGLLGVDAVVVLDEAHLVSPFEHMLRTIESTPVFRPREEKDAQHLPRFAVLSLSATGRTEHADVFRLADADFEHPILKARLDARKSLQIELLDSETTLEEALATHAWTLTDSGSQMVRVLVYSNSREIAQRAMASVENLAKGDKGAGRHPVQIDTELFVGGRRVFEREQARQRLKELGFIAGSEVKRTRPVFLFATAAGEVGVDLDADHMVCDLVAWERMIQRLGRVNRRGAGEAKVVLIVQPKPQPNKKEQEALKKQADNKELTDRELQCVGRYKQKCRDIESRKKPIRYLEKNADGSFCASPAGLLNLKQRAETDSELRQIIDDATTTDPLRPALTGPLVEAWAMTSLDKHPGRPRVIQPWLRGWIEEDPPQTVVVWRAHFPVRRGAALDEQEMEAFFEAAPPHTSELLETETFRVIEWISARAKSICSPREDRERESPVSCLRDEDVVAFVLDADGGLRKGFSFADLKLIKGDEKKENENLLMGATIIFDARFGGLKDGLLDSKANDRPKTADDAQDWFSEGMIGFRVRSVETFEAATPNRNWRERLRFASAMTEDGEPTCWLVVEKWRHDAATEEDRSASNLQLLDEHECWVEERARRLAQTLGLGKDYEESLALAARVHDEGKRAERWLRAFNAPKHGAWAKTAGPINYRLLDGYRHELGSLLRVEHDARVRNLSEEHRDLVLHLIVAHHGFARPVIGTNGCDDKPPSVLEETACQIALRFARLQARWRPWGLAWWEALLRAADQQASRDNESGTQSGERR